jgi:molybdenum ABC transporter molybdate-binding protein
LTVGQQGKEAVEMFRGLLTLHGMRRFMFALVCFTTMPLAVEIRAQSTSPHEITISAAISLKNAFEEIGKTFMKRHPGTKTVFNFGASGDLARQIEAGAPVDVFASAAQKDMSDLDHKNMIIKRTRKDFAGNRVVLIIPMRSAIQLTSFNDLGRGEIQKIAIGNPKTVPAGRYAEEGLRYLHLWDVIKDKLIFAENVRQVLDYVDCGGGSRTKSPSGGLSNRRSQRIKEGSSCKKVYCYSDLKRGRKDFTKIWLQDIGQT